MKKYKLLKDLPLANAGENVFVDKIYGFSSVYGIYKHSQNMNNLRILATIEEKDLDFWLEKIIEKPKSIWDLKEGDKFYYIYSDGEIDLKEWSGFYEDHLKCGGVFLTQEEAEKELEKRKAIQKIKKYCWENGIDNEFNQSKYNDISFYMTKEGNITHGYQCKNGNPIGCFNFENTKKILEKFEEELKIILDV